MNHAPVTYAPRQRPCPTGFTLAELLVVITIIALLVGILIPVVSRVRQAAWSANTQNTIANISNAIERYHMDHRAYPGVFSNAAIATPPGVQLQNSGGQPLTSTENLVLALMGGLTLPNPTQPTFTPTDVGRGPITNFQNGQRSGGAYIDEAASNLRPEPWDDSALPGSFVPEFVDRFPEPLSIIYVRANVGASGVIDNIGAEQYNHRHLLPYLRELPRDEDNRPMDLLWDPNLAFEYFRHPTLDNVPRAKDAFMLIAAGKDRRYGTEDDITYPPR